MSFVRDIHIKQIESCTKRAFILGDRGRHIAFIAFQTDNLFPFMVDDVSSYPTTAILMLQGAPPGK